MKKFNFNKILRFHLLDGDPGGGGEGGGSGAGGGEGDAGGGGGDHWSGSFQHESLAAPEARESFTKAMSKYGSEQEAVIGGFNAQKQAGKPFKLPESMDNLDEAGQKEFNEGISKLQPGMADTDFADFDFAAGAEEGQQPMSDIGKDQLKQFIVESGMPQHQALKCAAHVNKLNLQIATQQKEISEKLGTEVNAKMVAHFGTQAEADKVSEQVMLAFQQRCSSKEEFEATGKSIVQSGMTKHPELAIALAEMVAPHGKEAQTKQSDGKGGKQTDGPAPIKEQLPLTGAALGWK